MFRKKCSLNAILAAETAQLLQEIATNSEWRFDGNVTTITIPISLEQKSNYTPIEIKIESPDLTMSQFENRAEKRVTYSISGGPLSRSTSNSIYFLRKSDSLPVTRDYSFQGFQLSLKFELGLQYSQTKQTYVCYPTELELTLDDGLSKSSHIVINDNIELPQTASDERLIDSPIPFLPTSDESSLSSVNEEASVLPDSEDDFVVRRSLSEEVNSELSDYTDPDSKAKTTNGTNMSYVVSDASDLSASSTSMASVKSARMAHAGNVRRNQKQRKLEGKVLTRVASAPVFRNQGPEPEKGRRSLTSKEIARLARRLSEPTLASAERKSEKVVNNSPMPFLGASNMGAKSFHQQAQTQNGERQLF